MMEACADEEAAAARSGSRVGSGCAGAPAASSAPAPARQAPRRLSRARSVSEHIQMVARHPVTAWFDKNFVTLRKFLRKSSARDKLLATLQYYFQLRHSSLPETAKSGLFVAKAYENALSASRKGFRLFKWIDEYGKIRKIFLSPSRTVAGELWKLAPILMRLFAAGYYLVDNWVWSLQIVQGARYGRRDKNADLRIKWLKTVKNNFSLARTVIALLWTSRLIGILVSHPPIPRRVQSASAKRTTVWTESTENGARRGRRGTGAEYVNEHVNHPAISLARPWHECLLFHTVLQLRGMINFAILGKHLGFNKGMSSAMVGRLGIVASLLGMWKHWGEKFDYFVEYREKKTH